MWAHGETPNGTTGLTYRDFAEATKDIAWFYGLPCVDLRGSMGVNKITDSIYLLPDDVHPPDAGCRRMVEQIIPEFNKILYV
jgi:hypothetical protein